MTKQKKYTKTSIEKKTFVCPYCGRIDTKERRIVDLYYSGVPCVCSDNMSYPNKFAYFLFEKVGNQLDEYINEYSPEWAGKYRYDNYFVLDSKKYIVEMDGRLGHGKYKYKSSEKDVDGLKRDKEKDLLAEQHEIIMIRINCDYSEKGFIWHNIQESLLNTIFDLSSIDYNEIDILAKSRNIYKEICTYRENNPGLSVQQISNTLNISKDKIYSALKVGLKVGWSTFKFREEIIEERNKKIISYWEDNKDSTNSFKMAKELGVSRSVISRTLKDATIDGLIEYKPKKRAMSHTNFHDLKPIYVYDKNMSYIGQYSSANECDNNSLEDFGIQLFEHGIRAAANPKNKRNKRYKGYIFSYEKL